MAPERKIMIAKIIIQINFLFEGLNDLLRERLVCGINHKRIQQRLLSEGSTLSLEKIFGHCVIIRIENYSNSCDSQ